MQVHLRSSSAPSGYTTAQRPCCQLASGACPELVAHPSVDAWGYTITHRPSGLSVLMDLPGKERAAQALALLAASPVDWTLPGHQLAQQPQALQVVQQVAARLGCVVGAGGPGA